MKGRTDDWSIVRPVILCTTSWRWVQYALFSSPPEIFLQTMIYWRDHTRTRQQLAKQSSNKSSQFHRDRDHVMSSSYSWLKIINLSWWQKKIFYWRSFKRVFIRQEWIGFVLNSLTIPNGAEVPIHWCCNSFVTPNCLLINSKIRHNCSVQRFVNDLVNYFPSLLRSPWNCYFLQLVFLAYLFVLANLTYSVFGQGKYLSDTQSWTSYRGPSGLFKYLLHMRKACT